jgi:hypothetical protein
MSERQLLERTCDTCSKVTVLNGSKLTPEDVQELETWYILGKVTYDGQGNFLPVATHHCSDKCVSDFLQRTEEATDMERLNRMATA